ncbi:unnamed protein product [Mytilus coruscus]|uniref:Uncharacterized protein n=1 Tax=Mytilus coruscus TaxID=42192 RepID=A0A6J8C5S6_MYTCO|nr:unnamed protein product [Mytilus coruscus]
MIKSELLNLTSVLDMYNAEYPVDLLVLLTVQVENLHATSHFKEQFPTCLQYARNLFDTVHESVKRLVNWSAFYYTQTQSYYPVQVGGMTLRDMPVIEHLSPKRSLSADDQMTMRNWANDFGKCVRQRTVRQETTKVKAGTLPLNMYKKIKVTPGEKISFQCNIQSVPQENGENAENDEDRQEIDTQEGTEYVEIEKEDVNEEFE